LCPGEAKDEIPPQALPAIYNVPLSSCRTVRKLDRGIYLRKLDALPLAKDGALKNKLDHVIG